MPEVLEISELSSDKYTAISPNLTLPQLDDLESDGVSIQCVNSSEFVVGKQTNFNGPVTIINCANPLSPEGNPKEQEKEKIVIRDKVLSKSAEKVMQEMAGKNEKTEEPAQKELPVGKKWQKKVPAWLLKDRLLIPAIMFIGILVVVAVVVTVYVRPDIKDPDEQPLTSIRVPINRTHKFIYSKGDWGGEPPTSAILMKLPVPYVIISHSVTPECDSLTSCSTLLRNMQQYHFSKDYADIAYNFLVDSGGNVYEGRGWKYRNVHGGFENGRNIDICLIGDYSRNIKPTSKMMIGTESLIAMGVNEYKISRNYSLIAANATFATLSPGRKVYEVIKTWPHFDANPRLHVKDYED